MTQQNLDRRLFGAISEELPKKQKPSAAEVKRLKLEILQDMLDFISTDETIRDISKYYTPFRILECRDRLDQFILIIGSNRKDKACILEEVKKLFNDLNQLNNKCNRYLIQPQQRVDIRRLVDMVIAEAGIEFNYDVTDKWREW